MKNNPIKPHCGHHVPHTPPVRLGEINYTSEQINALLGMIPFKADRAEVPEMEKLSDVNYVGHVVDPSLLVYQSQPSWALVGSLKRAKPYFYYVEGYVPKGYTAGWNDISPVLGTYDLTTDKVSIFDFNLVTEYNVSRNHPNIKRDFSNDWGMAKFYYPEYDEYKPCKVYNEGDRVNMPDYTENTFIALRETSQPPFITLSVSSEFTLGEAVAITPEQYRYPGIRLTFVNSGTHQAETWFWLGGEWKNEDEWIKPSDGVTINNLPDEEDISATNDAIPRLQLKDKEYNKSSFSGLGRVYLRKNIVNGVNALDKNLFLKANTRYIIQYDYDLNGGTVEIPENCVLQFDGGSISNGTMVGSNTIIEAGLVKVFGTDVTIGGIWNIECWYPEWFGAVSSPFVLAKEPTVSTIPIQCALNAACCVAPRTVVLTGSNYYIDDTIIVKSNQCLKGVTSSPNHYDGHKLYQTVNKDAIKITSDDNTIWRVNLSNISIENKYSFNDVSNCGVRVYGNDVAFDFLKCSINNVSIQYFKKGFYYDGRGGGAFGYCKFDALNCFYNTIGFMVEGTLSSDSSNKRYPWINLNRWERCNFHNNSIGGVYFKDTRSQQENVFDECSFEGNGKNYNLSDYEEIGYAGFAFLGNNTNANMFGVTRFYNCYVEYNLPHRDLSLGYDANKEYAFYSLVFPNNIEEKSGAFICVRQAVEVKNCLLSKFVNLYMGIIQYGCRFIDNDYDMGSPGYNTNENVTIDHFFYFNNTTGFSNYCDIYIDEFYYRGDSGTFLDNKKSVYKLGSSISSSAFRNVKCYINHPLLDEPIEHGYNKDTSDKMIRSGIIYIGHSSHAELGHIKTRPLYSMSLAENISYFYPIGKTVRWKIVSDYSNTDNNYNTSMLSLNPIHISGISRSTVWTLTKAKIFYSKTVIENLTIDNQMHNWSAPFEFKTNEPIVFNNCTINMPRASVYLLVAKAETPITFVNCRFNLVDTSGGTAVKLIGDQYANVNITLENCTYQDGITVVANNRSWYAGSNIYKRVGDVVLANSTEYCEFDGADVVNPDGTLYTKARRIKNGTSEIKSLGNGIRLNKIVNDIDCSNGISLPWDTILDFQGGRFVNGTISLNRAMLVPMGMPLSYYIDTETCSIGDEHWAECQVIYDSELKKQKLWNGTSWVNLDGTPLTDSANIVEEQTE